jgi:quinol monooxygenase YgiN
MIVVHAVMRSRPERRAETRAALVAAQRATRDSDAGCLHYAFVVDLEDDCLFTCVEEWESMRDLEAHLASPHLADLDAALVGSTEGPAEIRVFDSERTRIPE